MTERSETVLLRDGRDRVTADNAGDDLDDEVGERPGHRAAFLVRYWMAWRTAARGFWESRSVGRTTRAALRSNR